MLSSWRVHIEGAHEFVETRTARTFLLLLLLLLLTLQPYPLLATAADTTTISAATGKNYNTISAAYCCGLKCARTLCRSSMLLIRSTSRPLRITTWQLILA